VVSAFSLNNEAPRDSFASFSDQLIDWYVKTGRSLVTSRIGSFLRHDQLA
jgi:hypothetical protein